MFDLNDASEEVSHPEYANVDIDYTEEVHVAYAIFLTSEIDSLNNFRDQIAQIMWDDQN